MSVEIHDKLIALLTEVEELKGKEAGLKAERVRHSEQITLAEGEVARCNSELDDVRENQLRLRREMDSLRDELFRHEEDETIVEDNSHIPGDGEGAEQKNTAAKMAWDARARHLKQVQ
jgi:uncharacterized coiled-coil DUF342 family protein